MAKPRKKVHDIQNRLKEIEDWARQGATNEIIAKRLGISRGTLWTYTKEFPDVLDALKRGRENLTIDLMSALIKKAVGYKYKETKRYIDENGKKKVEEIEKYSHPDVAAINLALKNYDPDNWSNDPKLQKLREEELELKKKQMENNMW